MHRQIYHISLLTAFAVAALLSSACSADDNSGLSNNPADDRQPVAFSATMADSQEAETRAVPNVMDVAGLKLATGGYGVFACYTGLHRYGDVDAQPDFMYNQKVAWTAGAWKYTPLKYWPNGEGEVDGSTGDVPYHVSFMAYAPYSDMSTGNAGYCIPSMSYQHEVGNPWITYRLHTDPANQVDLLYATPLLNKTKQSTAGALSFEFQHALACVGNEVTVTTSDAMKTYLNTQRQGDDLGEVSRVELVLKTFSITYTLTEKGRLVLWSADGKPHWETINSESGLVTRTVNYTVPADKVLYSYNGSSTGGTDYTDNDHGVFYIPIHMANHYQTAVATLTYEIRTYDSGGNPVGTTSSGAKVSAPVVLSDYAAAYQPGKNLSLTFRVKND